MKYGQFKIKKGLGSINWKECNTDDILDVLFRD